MNLKSGILSLLTSALVSTVLFSAGAAHADGGGRDRRHGASPVGIELHVHGPSCHHAPAPAPRPDGRYELRTTQRWVAGYQQKVWVPEVCETRYKHGRGHGHGNRRTVCSGGYYETRFVDGYYEPVEEWVWVANPPRYEHHRSGPSIQVTARF
jgi:hypothetical protein